MTDKVQNPKKKVFKFAGGQVELSFNTNFRGKWQGRFDDAQKFVDSEVLAACEPYVPLRTGMLRDSGITNTVIGSGVVTWNTPYARRRYYEGKVGTETGPLRGPHWFERAMAVHKQQIFDGVGQIIGGKVFAPRSFGAVSGKRLSVPRVMGFGRKKKSKS